MEVQRVGAASMPGRRGRGGFNAKSVGQPWSNFESNWGEFNVGNPYNAGRARKCLGTGNLSL